jgi:hypothetical protein
MTLPLVTELELAEVDLDTAGQAGDGYHQMLAGLREQGWLASTAVAFLVLDREAGEFFRRVLPAVARGGVPGP